MTVRGFLSYTTSHDNFFFANIKSQWTLNSHSGLISLSGFTDSVICKQRLSSVSAIPSWNSFFQFWGVQTVLNSVSPPKQWQGTETYIFLHALFKRHATWFSFHSIMRMTAHKIFNSNFHTWKYVDLLCRLQDECKFYHSYQDFSMYNHIVHIILMTSQCLMRVAPARWPLEWR